MGEVLILRHCWRDAFFCVCVAVDRFLTIGRRTGLPPLRPSGLLPHATRRALCALAGTIRTEIRGDDGRTLVACGPLLVSEDPESRWTKKLKRLETKQAVICRPISWAYCLCFAFFGFVRVPLLFAWLMTMTAFGLCTGPSPVLFCGPQ